MHVALVTTILLWLALNIAALPAGADHLWYAVCDASAGKGVEAYGAAWNYPTAEKAERAALDACRKQNPRISQYCRCSSINTHKCFLITQLPHVDYGPHGWAHPFDITSPFDTRAEAEAWAREKLAGRTYGPRAESVELLECAGVD